MGRFCSSRSQRLVVFGSASRRGSQASRKVSVSLSCGTWLRALEHVPQDRLTETFRLTKAREVWGNWRHREGVAHGHTMCLQEPRRSSPSPGQVCFLLFFCCVFPWFASWVPGLSLFPGHCFFRNCDFLQDVVGYTDYWLEFRDSMWCEDTARHALSLHSVQRIRRHVQDSTHPN